MKSKKIISVLVAVIVVILIAGFAVVNKYVGKIGIIEEPDTVPQNMEDFETDDNSEGLTEMSPDDVSWDEIEPMLDDDLLNILLVGQDRRPGQGRQRSDSMIVCSVNLETKQVSLISFLRDLYVQIPGYTDNRLNAAYVFGGFPLLKDTLKTNFGITVDGCFEVDFNGFISLIDEIGGVDIELTAAEARVVGGGAVVGINHLDGEKALSYARIRKIDSDFQRTNRQRTVLLAAFNKIKTRSLTQILDLLDVALPCVSTDMKKTEIYSLAMKLIPLATSVNVNTYYVPPEGTYSNVYIRGMAVLYPDLTAIRNILFDEYLPF